MSHNDGLQIQPVCRPGDPAHCGACSLSYDCERTGTDRRPAWPLVALALLIFMVFVI